MKTLQGKAFWRRKRAVLENQRVAIENRDKIKSDQQKNETLWNYACHGFSEIHPKIDPKSTQIEKIQNRSGGTPVVVSAVFLLKIEPDRDGKKRSGATPVVVSELDQT